MQVNPLKKVSFIVMMVSVSTFYSPNSRANHAANIIESTSLVGFGQAKYAEDFKHFDYVNPNAPKYGKITYGQIGTFDSFNRYGSRGVAVARSADLYDTLMFSPSDEIDSYYPLIASKVRYSSDYQWMEIDLNPAARFHDGAPITADDVAFSFTTFMTKGVAQYRLYYQDIASVKALNKHTVRIEMKTPNREKLFSFAQSTRVLPKHFWQDKDFSQPLSTPPIGSGPYKIVAFKAGQSVTYQLDENYWAKDLPVNVGRHNFKAIQYDYYRDDTVMLEAFKAGEFDLREENSAKFWANSYTGVNFDNGFIIKQEISHQKPESTQAFVFNTQKEVFHDPLVREALSYAMDFEWMNKNMFYNQYSRTRSYFQGTKYEAKGLPSPQELAILTPLKETIPAQVFTEEFQPPVTDGSGRIRAQQRKAFALLKKAGWQLQNKVMTHVVTGKPLTFELMIYSPTTERIAIPLQKNMKRMGIDMKIRSIDTTQYIKRLRDRDFDMVSSAFAANPYPSPNLMIVWNSNYMDSTYNTAGVNSPAIDFITEQIAQNQQHPDKLLALGTALDRILQWNFYAIPQWYLSKYRVAMWDKFERPDVLPTYDLGVDSWWISEQKAKRLPEKRR